MRFIRHSLMGLFLVSVTLAMFTYAGALVSSAVQERLSQEPRGNRARERVFAVNVVPVQFETVVPILTAFGEVASGRILEIRTATAGNVTALSPDFVEGGRVEAGELLAKIDPADAQAALDRVRSDLLDAQAEAREAARAIVLSQDELAAAEAQVDLRERALQRQLDLAARGVGTAAAVEGAEFSLSSAEQQLLTRRNALAQAEARVDQAQTRIARTEIALAEAQRRLNDTEITAGFAGVLSDVAVVEGRRVSANEQLARLVDPDQLEVAFRVSTQQYARLLNDNGTLQEAEVTVTLDVFGTSLSAKGRLVREGAAVGAGQTGRLLFARMTDARGFKPGDFVTVSISEPPLQRVARLPASALNAANEVLLIGEDDRLEAMQVTLMRRQGDTVLVRGRALAGREVVAERTPLLGAGIRVRPLRGEGASQPEAPEMLELSAERRAKLVAMVEANKRIPKEVRQRLLGQLDQDKVPARVVQRLENRGGS
ncbi:MAG: efflux RND transporter periplasmic adaptor subunit [Rhodobacteraceae bacterium]|nr:efflux RND transporter periplasmic adaptor subunit [Paracoccaceae bacterium]